MRVARRDSTRFTASAVQGHYRLVLDMPTDLQLFQAVSLLAKIQMSSILHKTPDTSQALRPFLQIQLRAPRKGDNISRLARALQMGDRSPIRNLEHNGNPIRNRQEWSQGKSSTTGFLEFDFVSTELPGHGHTQTHTCTHTLARARTDARRLTRTFTGCGAYRRYLLRAV